MIFDPAHPKADFHIRSCIRGGSVGFGGIVHELLVCGIIHGNHEDLIGMTRIGFDIFCNDEFETLFQFFYPGQSHSMEVVACQCTVGAGGGDLVCALYDLNRLEHDQAVRTLRTIFPVDSGKEAMSSADAVAQVLASRTKQ